MNEATLRPDRHWSQWWLLLTSLSWLAGASLSSAAETVTYILAPGSTITVVLNGVIVGPEPIAGSFDWIECGSSEQGACFDTTRLEFESASFSIHLNSPNQLVCGVDYDVPLFDEAVDASGIVSGLAQMANVYREGSYSDYPYGPYANGPWFPLSLEYPSMRIAPFGTELYVAELNIRAVADRDHDGVMDDIDECPETAARAAVTAHGCSIEQLAPCAGPPAGGQWKNHGQYVSAASAAVRQFLTEGNITQAEAEDVLTAASRSECGKNLNVGR